MLISCHKEVSVPITSVRICSQTWMDRNLDVSTYRNGDAIPQVTDPLQWAALRTGAWCYYNNDPTNGAIYGKLYNWYAVNDPRGLAPQGWHIPTDAEWTVLTDCLGELSLAGGKMKEIGTSHWESPNTDASNSSGFTGLPGGLRDDGGNFGGIGRDGYWWSLTESSTNFAWTRFLFSAVAIIGFGGGYKPDGISVRCLKD